MVYEASKLRREKVENSHLCIGVKCGYSDTISGIAGNPAVGYLFDKIVAGGKKEKIYEKKSLETRFHLCFCRFIFNIGIRSTISIDCRSLTGCFQAGRA
jgi:hypothetical protein